MNTKPAETTESAAYTMGGQKSNTIKIKKDTRKKNTLCEKRHQCISEVEKTHGSFCELKANQTVWGGQKTTLFVFFIYLEAITQ